jgi:glycerophosphoryl diester phosphodiesterase
MGALQHASFYQQHPGKNSLASYLTNLVASPHISPAYLSATEVGILKLIGPTAKKSGTTLILKILQPTDVEQSTNTTYGTLLQNLTDIRTYASGILVPKTLIWPIDNTTLYLQAHTSLVQDAHKAQLSVYAYDFANDQYPNSYNYSFDPIAEYLAYVGQPDFSVDGVLTDFPSTASEAISKSWLLIGGTFISMIQSLVYVALNFFSFGGVASKQMKSIAKIFFGFKDYKVSG